MNGTTDVSENQWKQLWFDLEVNKTAFFNLGDLYRRLDDFFGYFGYLGAALTVSFNVMEIQKKFDVPLRVPPRVVTALPWLWIATSVALAIQWQSQFNIKSENAYKKALAYNALKHKICDNPRSVELWNQVNAERYKAEMELPMVPFSARRKNITITSIMRRRLDLAPTVSDRVSQYISPKENWKEEKAKLFETNVFHSR
jgi:hypothetical protein